ncbi:MAG TPA: bifunctional 4-hydroxy-2-oxoglutarate aldolase/2-dehydro-3-deoxy-phosphogluconate aldolase [Propionibacteriaceae bacterium]|nr:bifunctional 4-hydroxy-2-oxoglutarate aldolase/2-dehydro-3-deoxy-phosphogluconate aldolase [Propionibacteriaceae bacterium]
MSAAEGYQAIRRSRLVAILRASSPDRLVAGAQVLVEEGIQTLELPLTSPAALDAIRRTADLAGDRALVGAGTIRTVDDARRAVDAGARFLVLPALTLPVLEHAVAHDIAVLPGAMTPTEISTALAAGAQLVKLFPAVTLGPEFLRQVLVPLRELAAVPTGGIELEHAQEWLDAGAVALGVGSPLSGEALEYGDVDQLRKRTRSWKAAVS